MTGADGFIGSHLVESLVEAGASIRALTCYNSFNSWGWLDTVPSLNRIEVVSGDIRDPHFCTTITKDIDIVFHLAALIAIPYSYKAPDSYVDTNIRGTVNICQSALTNGAKRVLHTSTSEVYGTARYIPIDEDHPLTPQSPYSASKIGADAMALSFHYAFGLPVTVVRPFNTYGPRQSARAVIPTIISQLAAGKREVELGDVATTRDFTYVSDTCRGFLAVAEMEAGSGEVFHIGSNNEISIGDLFAAIAELMGSDAVMITRDERLRPAASEVLRLWCDNSKLRDRTGFSPRVPLREGLRHTIDWFQNEENLKRYKVGIYNV